MDFLFFSVVCGNKIDLGQKIMILTGLIRLERLGIRRFLENRLFKKPANCFECLGNGPRELPKLSSEN